jgi:hypothetical protein
VTESITPLVPPGVDLRDFPFMPLDVVKLRDSDIAASASGDEFRAAVLLWCAAWHQVPAGSLPDDDVQLAHLAGYGRVVKEWKKVKQGAMHKWLRCADGRLYHKTIAEKVNEAWERKLRQRWKTECGRIKKHNDRHKTSIGQPRFEEWVAAGCPCGHDLPVPRDKADCPQDVPGEIDSKGQWTGTGTGTGTGTEILESNPPAQRPFPCTPAESDRPASARPPDPGARLTKSELDAVETACRAALGEAQPQDLVIGPMVEIVRKFGQERVSLCLASESRRPRERSVRTWKIWARIIEEALSAPPQRPPPDRGGGVAKMLMREMGYGDGCSIEENRSAETVRMLSVDGGAVGSASRGSPGLVSGPAAGVQRRDG